MHVTRSAKAPLYHAPDHHGMTMRRLQGHEAGPSSSMWLGLLEIQPGGGTAAVPSPHEKIYFVQAGEVTISNGDHADVLKAGDSCRFAAHEIRKLRNDSAQPATLVLAMALR
jgi:quercetin dioxygenase-like cupin family protein